MPSTLLKLRRQLVPVLQVLPVLAQPVVLAQPA